MSGEEFANFVRRNEESFYRIAYSYVRSREDALDIVQDSIEKALRKLPGLRDDSRIKPWFCRILVNESIDCLRRRRGTEPVDESLPAADETGRRAEALALYDAVSKLPPKYKDVILLYYYREMTTEEIARVLGISQSAVWVRLKRARDRLKTQLKGWYFDE